MSKKIITLVTCCLVIALITAVVIESATKLKHPPKHWELSNEDAMYDSVKIESAEIANLISEEANFINQKYSVNLKVPEFSIYKIAEPTIKDNAIVASYCLGNIYLFPQYFTSDAWAESIAHEGVHLLFHTNYGDETYFAECVGDNDFYGINLEEAYADLLSRQFLEECYPDKLLNAKPSYYIYTSQIETLDYALNLATARYFITNDFAGFHSAINQLAEINQQTPDEEDLDAGLLFSAMFDNSMQISSDCIISDPDSILHNLRFVACCVPKNELSKLEAILNKNGLQLNGPIEYLTYTS